MKKKIIILMVIVFVMMPLLAGCIDMFPVTVRGGGWLPYYGGMQPKEDPVEPEGKTSFGFTVECYNVFYTGDEWEYDVRGHFLYVDHNNKMKVRGKVLNATAFDGGGVIGGDYTAEGGTGSFVVQIYDWGEPSYDDYFIIHINGGPYDGYHNEGPLGGGNIQIFPVQPTPVP